MTEDNTPRLNDEIELKVRGKVHNLSESCVWINGSPFSLDRFNVTIIKRANHPDNDEVGTIRGNRYVKLCGNSYTFRWWDLKDEKWALCEEVEKEKVTTSLPHLLAHLDDEHSKPKTCPCGHRCDYSVNENRCSNDCRCDEPRIEISARQKNQPDTNQNYVDYYGKIWSYHPQVNAWGYECCPRHPDWHLVGGWKDVKNNHDQTFPWYEAQK